MCSDDYSEVCTTDARAQTDSESIPIPFTKLETDEDSPDRALAMRRVLLLMQNDPVAVGTSWWKIKYQEYKRLEGYRLALICYAILFIHYIVATFLSSFFPDYATAHGISDSVDGVIFAACPAGMAISSPFAITVVRRLGLRTTVLFGMLLNALCLLLFGLVPSVFGEESCLEDASSSSCALLQTGYVLTYFLSGLVGALADTACMMALQNWSKGAANTTIATASMVCGIGCLVGPTIGGSIYDVGEYPTMRELAVGLN